MKDIKFAIFDIDRTLVDTKKELMPITKEMLEELHSRGVKLGLASGRPIGEHLIGRAKKWDLSFQFDVLIGMNGGQLYDVAKDTMASQYPLSKETLHEIMDMMEPTGVNCFVYRGERTLCLRLDEFTLAASIRNQEPAFECKDRSELWSEETAKILFRCGNVEEAAMAMEHASKHPSDKYAFFRTSPIMVEFQDPRVNKGLAMKEYCNRYDIPLDKVVSFGDMTNDNYMLAYAGLGVAMANAGEDTKAVADVITEYTNDEDGVGRFIRDHILKD